MERWVNELKPLGDWTMNVREFVAEMREAIEEAKSKGATEIKCDNIIAYLDEVEKTATDDLTVVDMEKYKAQLLHWIEQARFQYESNLEMFRSVITAGQGAIKSGL